VHRRFTEWTRYGLWVQLHQQFLHRLAVVSEIDWSRVIVDSIALRAQKGALTPAEPGRPRQAGSKIHILCDRTGVPLTLLISAANVPDAQLLLPLLDSVIPVRGRRGRPRHPSGNSMATRPTTSARFAPRHRRTHRPQGHRVIATPRPASLDRRTHVLADQLIAQDRTDEAINILRSAADGYAAFRLPTSSPSMATSTNYGPAPTLATDVPQNA
jgi:hypothetical protein